MRLSQPGMGCQRTEGYRPGRRCGPGSPVVPQPVVGSGEHFRCRRRNEK